MSYVTRYTRGGVERINSRLVAELNTPQPQPRLGHIISYGSRNGTETINFSSLVRGLGSEEAALAVVYQSMTS